MAKAKHKGVKIESVTAKSPSDEAGLRSGDTLMRINGQRVSDTIDYMFLRDEPELIMDIVRKGKKLSVVVAIEEYEDPGFELAQFKIDTCGNKCIFCFVSQLPKGLRKTLYLKDEDYRMSFLFGNYVTLASLKDSERDRIIEQRLSPLYVSVHSTEPDVRAKLLGNDKAPDIMKQLKFFAASTIRFHAQIVLCPGFNDGKHLKKTITDLTSLYPYLLSVAVVPVGLTAYCNKELRPLSQKDALDAIATVDIFRKRFMKKHGDPLIYAADEMYLKAAAAMPKLKEYGELHQIENGVGMIPLFQHEARKVQIPQVKHKRRYLTYTGKSFYPYVRRFTDKLRRNDIDIKAVDVENHFFGAGVTVAGLLTGRDVLRALSPIAKDFDRLLIPDVMLRDGEGIFLDDVTVKDIERVLKIKARVFEAGAFGLMDTIAADGRR
jgi:putative radical SAM enzyme (TIGR03279 family)